MAKFIKVRFVNSFKKHRVLTCPLNSEFACLIYSIHCIIIARFWSDLDEAAFSEGLLRTSADFGYIQIAIASTISPTTAFSFSETSKC